LLYLSSQMLIKANNNFFFTRLQYNSGDWNTDQRMPANLLHSIVEYTNIPVDINEKVVTLSGGEIYRSPFCYLSGHKLVQFNEEEGKHFTNYVNNGGFIFVDDCNHDIDGLFAKTFESEMVRLFGQDALVKLSFNHNIYTSFFNFETGPPTTSFELNGWGDDLVHDYLKAIIVDGKIGVLYSNKDYGCEWDYDFRNKRFMAKDNTQFGVNIVLYAIG